MKARIALASPLLLAACQTAAAPDPGQPPGAECAATSSGDWAAWVNNMPGPGASPTLIVTGTVSVPTGGYRIEWADIRVAESHPVQVFAELRAIPPTGGATQAVTAHEVRGEWPMSPPVGSLTVTCGDRTLAQISPVETAR